MKRTCVVLCLLLGSVFASAQTADCVSLTRQALDLSGVNQTIDNLTAILASDQFAQQFRGRESADEFISVFRPIMMKAFNAASVRRDLQERMVAGCEAQQMAQTVQALQTPLQAKMLALEAAANSPEGHEKLKKYINIAKTVPPTDDRMDDLDGLDSSSGASDMVTDTVMAMMRGMMKGAGAPQDVIQQFQAHRNELKAQMQNNVELSMSVTYHGVTRPELRQYAREVGAPPLKSFYALVSKSFAAIFEERAVLVGQELKKTMDARKN